MDTPRSHCQRDQRLVEQHAVLDGIHAVLDRQPRAGTAVRVRRELQAVAMGRIRGALHLARRKRTVGLRRGDARHAAGRENLDQPGALRGVRARPAARCRLRSPPPSARGRARLAWRSARRRRRAPGPSVWPARDLVAQQEIDVQLLPHDAHRRDARQQIRPHVAARRRQLLDDGQLHLLDLVAARRHDRHVRVCVDRGRAGASCLAAAAPASRPPARSRSTATITPSSIDDDADSRCHPTAR